MTTELATVPANGLAVRHGRPLIDAAALVEEGQQRQLLMRYVQAHMQEGTDFGVIPGTKNKTLLKPGAEKLTDLFRCTPEFEIVRAVEDFDRPLFHYVFRCKIVVRETGQTVAEGFGSCSSQESKYRYRNGERSCPECGKAAIIKGKAEYGGGWLCFGKKGGCGAKFADTDPQIGAQQVGRVENPDLADVVNTVLKIAKKRAHVDAAIALARCSDMFTQDMEDYQDPARPGPAAAEVVRPTQEAVNELLRSRGCTWKYLIQSLNSKYGTNYLESNVLPEIPADQLVDICAFLETLPVKQPRAKGQQTIPGTGDTRGLPD
jgi:hypothetical protein